MKKVIKNNLIPISFSLCFVLIEFISVSFVDGFSFLTKPYYFLALLLLIVAIMLLCKNKIAQIIIGAVLILFQSVLAWGMVFLYTSNGTYFEWSMLDQRSDAAGALQKIKLNVPLILICLALFVLYWVVSIFAILKSEERKTFVGLSKEQKTELKKELRLKRKQSKVRFAVYNLATSLLLCASVLVSVLVPVSDGIHQSKKPYISRLNSSNYSVYQQYGITGNAVYQMISGSISNKVDTKHLENVEKFVYGDGTEQLETSKYFGVSKGNNLVYVLVESFEWYAWLNEKYDSLTLRSLFPNLYRFMNESLVLENFYAREKTDTSETLSLIGSNPTGKYINYGFENNELAWALPNVLKNSGSSSGNNFEVVNSFHANNAEYYNRNQLHKSLGFDQYYSIEEMGKYNVFDDKYFANPDATTFDAMKNIMFPSLEDEKQFFSYIITFSMHGPYIHRDTLENGLNGENYYNTLDEHNVYLEGVSEKDDYLRNYAASVLDFDRAIGVMLNTLEEKGLLENTTIVLFADHNTYFHNLSYFAKEINRKFESELYRVPCMIYDQKLMQKIDEEHEKHCISKFTTTADLIPTILDLFGIHGWKNLYFGTSVFVENVESIIYSRAYGIFVTDKLICYSPNKLLYHSDDFKESDKEDFINRAKVHLTKLEYLDKIYYSDYFKNNKFVYL